jgi:dihydrolipoamide dehydrogenase
MRSNKKNKSTESREIQHRTTPIDLKKLWCLWCCSVLNCLPYFLLTIGFWRLLCLVAHILVIGAGPGGYVTAIRLAQLGQKVTLCDKAQIGGVCLNQGCISTKALLYAASVIQNAKEAQSFGIKFNKPEIDLPALNHWKDQVVQKLRQGIEYLFQANNIEFIQAEARFIDNQTVELKKNNGNVDTLKPNKIIVATGSKPAIAPGIAMDGQKIIASDDALQLRAVPNRLLIVGAGAVGLEFATIYSRLGSKVTVVEMMEQIIPGTDSEIARHMMRILQKQGIEIHLKTKLEIKNSKFVIHKDEKEQELAADKILVAIGRKPLTDNLGLENTGIAQDKDGFINVSKFYSTRTPNVYAVGDVVGPPLLAHKAMAQGIAVAELIAGTPYSLKFVPNCVYTDPELATVGITEDEAKKFGKEILVGRANLNAIGRAHTMNRIDGMAKVIADKNSDRILGIHLLAPEASNIIAEAVLALSQEMTVKQFIQTIHPHPTFTEVLLEAAENVHKRAIHILNR